MVKRDKLVGANEERMPNKERLQEGYTIGLTKTEARINKKGERSISHYKFLVNTTDAM